MADDEGLKRVNEHFCKDHTHTSLKGARLNAEGVAEGLKAAGCPLADMLK